MKRKDFEEKLAAQAAADPAFKARLIADPTAVLTEELGKIKEGVGLPPGIKVTVLEEKPDQLYIVLPANPAAAAAGTLSADQLRQVAGGTSQANPGAMTSVVVSGPVTNLTAVVDGVVTVVGPGPGASIVVVVT